jgi:hypothetical protein
MERSSLLRHLRLAYHEAIQAAQRVTARLDPAASVRPGEVIGLAPAGEPYHWFRAADGSRVEDAPAPAPRPPLAARLA